MTLRETQVLFMNLLPRLIDKIYESGYEVTGGDLWAKTGHKENSNHYIRLAIDFNLFKDGTYLTTCEHWNQFGTYWKSLHPLCRYGGDFKIKDCNHISLEYEGRS